MNAPAVPACRNCGAPAGGRYCPECGQETALHPPSAREFLQEFVGHYVALEGALWRTLKKLVVPGALTVEYLAGRRRAYVPPLRLYLTASLLFFLATRLLSVAVPLEPQISLVCRGDPACIQQHGTIDGPNGKMTPAAAAQLVRDTEISQVPYAMFFLVPVFALVTRAAYRRRAFNYGEHLVFALHVHAFAFFLGTLLSPVHVRGIVMVPAALYLLLAMRRVFGGRVAPLLARFVLVCASYAVVVILALSTIASLALSF